MQSIYAEYVNSVKSVDAEKVLESKMESCWYLVHFICDFTKNDRFHFYLTTLYISTFDTVQGQPFYWFITESWGIIL